MWNVNEEKLERHRQGIRPGTPEWDAAVARSEALAAIIRDTAAVCTLGGTVLQDDKWWVQLITPAGAIEYPVMALDERTPPTVSHAVSALWTRVGAVRKYRPIGKYAEWRKMTVEEVSEEYEYWSAKAHEVIALAGDQFGNDDRVGEAYDATA